MTVPPADADADPAAVGAAAADVDGTAAAAAADVDAARRRELLADLDLLPETTSDEAGAHAGRSDDDYRADRPPHHGD